ncbi:MAG: autotransporter outer membrane beta-barrel domain-containing protein, partial [Pseudomonadota bacterium]
VNGSLGGQVAVAGGGTLSGTGSIDRLQGDAGGTVAPGDNGIGTLSVAGDAVFTEGSTLALKVAPDGSSDLLAVAGRTTISGSGTVLHVTGTGTSFPVTNIYTVLTSESGIDGQFASVQDTLPDLDLQAIYQPNVLQLRYVSTSGVTSPKQIHPSAQAAALKASRLFAQTMRRRGGFYAGTNENTRAFTAEPTLHKLAVWSAAMGETSQTDPSGQTSGWEADTGGIAFGLENRFERFDGVIGLAGAITNTQIDSGSSDADVNAWHLGGYGSAAVGSLTLSGALSYDWQEYEFGRHVPLVGGANRARGKTDGGTFTASGEAMYDLGLGYPSNGLRFGPLATLETIHSQRDGFAETGAGVLNLNVSRKSAHQIISGLGVAVGLEDRSIAGMRIRADARVTWEHVFGDRAVTAASAIPIAGTSFAASSAATDRDRIALGLGGAVHLSERIAAHIRYDGSFSGTSTHHAGAAGLTYRF